MRIKLFLLLTLFVALPALAQRTGVQGVVVDAESGMPVSGATVILNNQNIMVTTGPQGDFLISNATAGTDDMSIFCYGFKDWTQSVNIVANVVEDLGKIKIKPETSAMKTYTGDNLLVNESQLEDEEGASQAVGTLAGASDNVYYNAASYDFSIMRFRLRGYESDYTDAYINGVNFNDPARGRFNYSMLGGMNQAFKRKSIGLGLDATNFSFGQIGGATNINTFAQDYAPGFRGSVAYTNANYYLRGMATYSTGLMKNGWAVTLSAIGRYADEGVVPGSFYNSWGYFLSVDKVFNPQHTLSLTAFGAPTKRAGTSATYQECYDLTGNNLYNPNWGYQDGKKRNAKVVESFDPTFILNWVWKPNSGTTLNTGFGFRSSNYASSALNWYNAPDPRPDYYRYLPSYYDDESNKALYTDLWQNDESVRQLDWNHFYQVNYLNNLERERTGKEKGATYILENRHSNQLNYQFNSTLNMRLNDIMTLQAGVGTNYTVSSYYKTVKDLLGGSYWLDIDQFAERDFPSNTTLLQNNLNDPNRHVTDGQRFGYDYNINSFSANAWLQNIINLAKWDINYGLKLSYTTYQRDGKMRNGRAPENSYGKGERHQFDNAGLKLGITYKLDGRNSFVLHGFYGTRAPLFDQAYVSPRIKDDAIKDLNSERLLSGDISYVFNYRRFKGSLTGFWTDMSNGTERTSFYDDQYRTFMNYVLTNVRKAYRGVELGVAFKVTPSVTVSAAGTYARYQYKNRPTGTRSYENGMSADTTQVVYLKNFYVSGTPQQAYSFGIDWAAPGMWFFNINCAWMGDSYIDLSPIRHEAMPKLWEVVSSTQELEQKIDEITAQQKLKDAFVLNASVGKLIYLNRTSSLNINLSVDNILNNRNIQTSGYQQGRFDYTTYSTAKYPNKYYYAQGIKVFLNLGVKF